MKKKTTPASYKLLNIFLIEAYFKRNINIDIEGDDLENDIDINAEPQFEDNHIAIFVTLDFSIGNDNVKAVESKIKMLGLFECVGSTELSINDFVTTNGPAIIFPFLREHLATNSMKSGITPILLPPINFKKLSEEKSKKQRKK